MVRVILDIFSGRPNPSWELSDFESRQLIERVAGRVMAAPDAVQPAPGFRGFLIAATADDQAGPAGLPDLFYLGPGAMPEPEARAATGRASLAREEIDDATLWLLNTTGPAVEEPLLAYVEETVRGRHGQPPAEAALGDEGAPHTEAHERALLQAAGCTIQNTPFNPGFWNQPWIQPFNNCNNYAMNFPSNTVAQPGRISGQLYSAFTCAEIGDSAAADGCSDVCSGFVREVALVIWPGFDFHWYRRHSDGFWAHKLGPAPAINTDSQGRAIGGTLNPETCDRGPYTQFCGYRFSQFGMRVV